MYVRISRAQSMQLPFFSVSVRKLVVMHVVTFGLYQAYWFYRHWIAVRNFNQIYISAAARTVVSPVFAFGLFKRILDTSRFSPATSLGFSAVLGGVLLLSSVASHLPPPFLWIALLSVVPMVPMQVLANRANFSVDPLQAVNAKLSRLNWVAVVFGGTAVLLVTVGVMASGR